MEDISEGGDPACWTHLFEELAEPAVDPTCFDAYEVLADAVVVTDRHGIICLWNQAAAELFGWTAQHAVGQTLDLIIPEKYRARHWQGYGEVMATGRTAYADRLLEVPALHRDGHRISIAFTVSLLFEAEVPAGVVAVVRDETSRRAELSDLRGRLRGDR